MKTALLLILSACSSLAALGPHPVARILFKDTQQAVLYKDRMSDGTYRDSQIVKTVYPVRITLVQTNDFPSMWALVYEAAFHDGRRETNENYVVKTDPRDRLKIVPVLPPMPTAVANSIHKKALALAIGRTANHPQTNKVIKMAPYEARLISSKIKGNQVEMTLSDGTVKTAPLRLAHTARVTSDPRSQPVPEPTGNHSREYLLGFAAGVLAAGGIMASKKAIKA